MEDYLPSAEMSVYRCMRPNVSRLCIVYEGVLKPLYSQKKQVRVEEDLSLMTQVDVIQVCARHLPAMATAGR